MSPSIVVGEPLAKTFHLGAGGGKQGARNKD